MRRKGKHRLRLIFIVGAVFAFLIAAAALFQEWIRPTVETRLIYQAKTYAAVALEQAVQDELDRLDLSYKEIIRVTREGGKITSLETDARLLNEIKSRVTLSAAKKLDALSDYAIPLPLGSLLGLDIFSGKGPQIGFSLQPQSAVQTEICQEFLSAGINQTLHRVYLRLRVDVAAAVPGFRANTAAETQMELAQTVIVGETPGFMNGWAEN